jgi:hypothetical protein
MSNTGLLHTTGDVRYLSLPPCLNQILGVTSQFCCFCLRNFAHRQEIAGMLANCLDFSRRAISVLSNHSWKHSFKYTNVRYQLTTSFLETSGMFTHKHLRHGTVSMSEMIPLTSGLAVVCAATGASVHSAFLLWFRYLDGIQKTRYSNPILSTECSDVMLVVLYRKI